MRDAVRSAFVEFTTAFEGCVPWLYLDVKNLVTVGIGNLVDPIQYAISLPFVDRATGLPAGRDAIAAEWLRVKGDSSLARLGHRAAERITRLRLTPEGVSMLVARKLDQNDQHLRARFPDFEEWPACAQLAVHSMAWACGPAFHFPKLEVALAAKDFEGASKECHMNEAGNPGLVPRNVANKILMRNAAFVRDAHLDPDTLEWRKVLAAAAEPERDNQATYPTIHPLPDTVVDLLARDTGDEPPEAA